MGKDVNGEDRRGSWMQTFSGRQFWPLDPRASEVNIYDIAHGLAMKCRYSGQSLVFYSVAEHSILVSHAVPPAYRRHALMHDGTEAYLGDMIRPLKYEPDMAGFRDAEARLEPVIFERFGVAPSIMSYMAVDEADTRILIDERDQVMFQPPPAKWSGLDGFEPLGCQIWGYGPEAAERMFLRRFVELFPEHADGIVISRPVGERP